MHTSLLSCIATAILFASAASNSAAKVEVTCDNKLERVSRGCTIHLTGEIEKGDSLSLRKVIQKPLQKGWHYGRLYLESPGGDVQEAVRVAEVVREAMLSTTTTYWLPESVDSKRPSYVKIQHGACVSACFLIWIAGTERFSMSAVVSQKPVGIGLHRPYFSPAAYQNSPSSIAAAQQNLMSVVREYMRREQVPEEFIDKMLERSSREVYWLQESGDPFALNGKSAWFEEMMIARCDFDPVYDRVSQNQESYSVSINNPNGNEAMTKYFKWRKIYNACEYRIKSEAQQNMRK